MNIFKFLNYRDAIRSLMEERRQGDRRWSYQNLAETIRVPKSYLSRVTHGDADLSHDQLFLTCEYFQLTADESHYLDVLLQYERCGLERRREILRQDIVKLQKKFLDPRSVLSSAKSETTMPIQSEYYLNPILQIVHAALAIDAYQTNLTSLAQHLNLSWERLNDAIHRLERIGLCER